MKRAESDQIVIALRDRGFPVEYLLAPDEGHGFARPVNNMAMFATAEKFFAKHLRGRIQESMTAEVATRLKEITVDPKTVTLAEEGRPVGRHRSKARDRPAPGHRQVPGHHGAGGQNMAMTITR